MNQITKHLAVKISELCEMGDKLRKVGSIDMPSECGYSCEPKREFMEQHRHQCVKLPPRKP